MKTLQIVTTASRIGEQWAGIPGVEVTPGGRLFVVWYSGGRCEPAPENTIYLCASDDGGAIFSSPVTMVAPRDGARAFDPTLWFAPNGVLWLIFNRGNKDTAEHGVYARCCTTPDAAVPGWGEEFRVEYDAPYSFRMNKPTALSSGEWVMPVTLAAQPIYAWFAGAAQRQGVAISRDQGKSWTLHGAVDAPEWALENMIIERQDGTLAMYIRTGAGVLWLSLSMDRGLSWSSGIPTTISNPGSRFYLRQLPDSDWLLLNSPDPTLRTGIVAQLSSDEGASWHGQLLLDSRDNVSYPDAALATDGTIYAVHDRDRNGVGEILLSIFRKEEI